MRGTVAIQGSCISSSLGQGGSSEKKLKRQEKTGNNSFHAFSPIPNLVFPFTASFLQLPLHTLFCKQRWRKWSGHWTRVFFIANIAQSLISVGAVIDHADPGHFYSSDIYFSEVLRLQRRNLPPMSSLFLLHLWQIWDGCRSSSKHSSELPELCMWFRDKT